MYRTVILDAFYNLEKNCPEAKLWLLTPSDDLTEVADYASLHTTQIEHIAQFIISKKLKLPAWRIWRYTWATLQ